MMKSEIAVLMSCTPYDSFEQLIEAIISIDNQAPGIKSHILLAIDGEMPVERVEKVRELPLTNAKLTVFPHEHNLGLAHRLNELIDYALQNQSVKYLARMDADDICLPNRLTTQIDALQRHPEIDVIGSSVIEINEKGEQMTIKRLPTEDDALKTGIIKQCPFNHPTVVFRRRVFDDGNRYPSHLRNTQDYYLWVMLAAKKIYRFHNISEPLLLFRINHNFYKRRGLKKAKNDIAARIYAMRELKLFTASNILHTAALGLSRILPTPLQKIIYQKLRRGTREIR